MSWHCLICGKSDNVTGTMYLTDIKGGVPLHYVLHLSCLANLIDYEEAKFEIKNLEGIDDE